MYEEPELRLSTPQGIRFLATVSPELKKEVESDENKCFGFVIAPLTYFVQIDLVNDLSQMDWVKTFEKEEMSVITMDDAIPITRSHADGTITEHVLMGGVADILYNNTNREFMAFAYVKTTKGDKVSYKYASYPNGVSYKTQARSFAYVTSKALNDCTVNYTYYSEADIEFMKRVINDSVDFAHKLPESTDDGSMYEVTLSETAKTLEIGETFTLKVNIEEKVKVPVWWTTTDASVVTVKDGILTAHGKGTATVYAVVAGELYACEITVDDKEESTKTEESEETEEAAA